MNKAQELKELADIYAAFPDTEKHRQIFHAAIDAQQSIIDEQRCTINAMQAEIEQLRGLGEEVAHQAAEIERLTKDAELLREALRTVNWLHEDKGAVLRISAAALGNEAIAAGSQTELEGGV